RETCRRRAGDRRRVSTVSPYLDGSVSRVVAALLTRKATRNGRGPPLYPRQTGLRACAGPGILTGTAHTQPTRPAFDLSVFVSVYPGQNSSNLTSFFRQEQTAP